MEQPTQTAEQERTPATEQGSVALLPCPFCGSERLLHCMPHPTGHYDSILCLWCKGEGPPAKSKQEAIDLWNQREPPPPSKAA